MNILRVGSGKANCIIFHGMTRSGPFFKNQIDAAYAHFWTRPENAKRDIQFSLPTAELQAFTPAGNKSSHVWADLKTRLHIDEPEKVPGLGAD